MSTESFLSKLKSDFLACFSSDPHKLTIKFKPTDAYLLVKDTKLRSLKNLLVAGKIELNTPILWNVGHTLLQESIIFNKYEIFRLCLTMDAEVNTKDLTGTYPIFNAIYLGRNIMIKELLGRKNLDLTVRDGVQRTVLEAAEFYDNYEAYELLFQAMKDRGIDSKTFSPEKN